MAILLVWGVLLGAILGRVFKVLVLFPACAFLLAAGPLMASTACCARFLNSPC
jgi:hypothetical protein